MENLNIADFRQWANDPMTVKVRDYLLKERESFNSLDDSALIEKNTYSDGMQPLEALGLEVAMRSSVIRGIDSFCNFDELSIALFGGNDDN